MGGGGGGAPAARGGACRRPKSALKAKRSDHSMIIIALPRLLIVLRIQWSFIFFSFPAGILFFSFPAGTGRAWSESDEQAGKREGVAAAGAQGGATPAGPALAAKGGVRVRPGWAGAAGAAGPGTAFVVVALAAWMLL